jgi:hypothetical protein
LYNACAIPLRAVFPYQDETNVHVWLAIDYAADLVYLVDLVFVRHRVMFLNKSGFFETNKKALKRHYVRNSVFYVSSTNRHGYL